MLRNRNDFARVVLEANDFRRLDGGSVGLQVSCFLGSGNLKANVQGFNLLYRTILSAGDGRDNNVSNGSIYGMSVIRKQDD